MRFPSAQHLALTAAALLLAACQTLPTFNSFAPPVAPATQVQALGADHIDDSELAPRPMTAQLVSRLKQELARRNGSQQVFRAIQVAPRSKPLILNTRNGFAVTGEFRYTDHLGQVQPGSNATVSLFRGSQKVAQALTNEQGQWGLEAPSGQYRLEFTLENPRWKISNYAWDAGPVNVQGATDAGVFALEKGQQNAEAAFIHGIYNRALALFAREQIDTKWWKRQISTEWPADGNYYSFYTVHLTGAQQWDVNGHEIGHAIYAQALNASSTGGQHKIDECYSGTLALSEGFATFFSGAVNLDKADPDAKFGEFLVPRRAPIRVENTPGDVCKGNRNEWRVASVLWDVYDTAVDGQDQLALPLKDIWAAFSQPNKPAMKNALDGYALLKEFMPAENQNALKQVFLQNTMEITP